MPEDYFPQNSGAALAEELGLDEPNGKATTQLKGLEIEEPEPEEEPETPEETESPIPSKFLDKKGNVKIEVLAKSYSELEKKLTQQASKEKEMEKGYQELHQYATNLYNDYVKNIKPQQAVAVTEQFTNQQNLSEAQQGKLLEALERDPERTLVQMIGMMVEQQLNPVITPLRAQAVETHLDRAVNDMANDEDLFPDFWEVKDTMADVIEEFAKDYPGSENDPRLLKYAYEVARGRSTDNLRKEAEEKGRQSALETTQKKRKAFAEGNYGKSGRGGKSSEADEMMEAMMKTRGGSSWFTEK